MPRVSHFLALFLLLCLAAPASALKLKDRPAKCPVCATEFIAYEVVEPNFNGGMDADFFLRALGEPAENYGVWMCPNCYFSALPAVYNDPLPGEKRTKLLIKLEPFKKMRPDSMPERPDSQRKIPPWFKWRVAYSCYETGCLPVDARSPQAYLGDVALRGSWVTRVSGNPAKHSDALEIVYKAVMEEFRRRNKEVLKNEGGGALCIWFHSLGDLMVKGVQEGGYTAEERPVALLMAGGFYRESGDLAQAREMLDQAAASNSLEVRRVAERESELLAIEQEFQRKAIDHFKRALEAGEVKGTPREPLCVYLIGELSRRLGDGAEAGRWFDRIAALPAARPELHKLIEEQRKLLPK